MRVSIPLRTYASLIASISSIFVPSVCLEEERCDTLMKDDIKIESKFAANESFAAYRGPRLLDSLKQRELTITLLLLPNSLEMSELT